MHTPTGLDFSTVAQAASGTDSNHIMVYILSMAAGLLGGGAWSTYKNGAPLMSLVLSICAIIAGIGAVLCLLGAF
jgi:hypothetical protein